MGNNPHSGCSKNSVEHAQRTLRKRREPRDAQHREWSVGGRAAAMMGWAWGVGQAWRLYGTKDVEPNTRALNPNTLFGALQVVMDSCVGKASHYCPAYYIPWVPTEIFFNYEFIP